MARTSTRRRKGCGLCKPWKHAETAVAVALARDRVTSYLATGTMDAADALLLSMEII